MKVYGRVVFECSSFLRVLKDSIKTRAVSLVLLAGIFFANFKPSHTIGSNFTTERTYCSKIDTAKVTTVSYGGLLFAKTALIFLQDTEVVLF